MIDDAAGTVVSEETDSMFDVGAGCVAGIDCEACVPFSPLRPFGRAWLVPLRGDKGLLGCCEKVVLNVALRGLPVWVRGEVK